MLFPIDHGNSAMKTVNFVFPSGLIDNPIRPPVDTEMLEYDGKFWTLSGQRISYMRDKTKDERYWILTLFAIAKELEKSGNTSPMVEADLAVAFGERNGKAVRLVFSPDRALASQFVFPEELLNFQRTQRQNIGAVIVPRKADGSPDCTVELSPRKIFDDADAVEFFRKNPVKAPERGACVAYE